MKPPPVSPASPSGALAGPRLRTAFLIAGAVVVIVLDVIHGGAPIRSRDIADLLIIGCVLLVLFAIPAWVLGWLVARLGRWRKWPAQSLGWIAFGVMGASIATGGFLFGRAFLQLRDRSKLSTMLPRQPTAALDQYYLEYPDRIFISFDDIVGPDRYIKAFNTVDGADLSFQFPIRQHWFTPLSVRLPDGSTVNRHEVLAVVAPSGLIATDPRPQSGTGAYNPRRVYQLEAGLRFRGTVVTDLPPDPEGREGRDQDGVHVVHLPEGRRFEITYRGGVPDGPFKAYRADGTLWGEATYRKGKVVEAWVITRSGRRFDELKDRKALETALTDEAKAEAETLAQRGLGKLAAQDFAGAIADFTAAINNDSLTAYHYLGRSDAKLGLGDIEGAIQDCQQARSYANNDTEQRLAVQKLQSLEQRRAAR